MSPLMRTRHVATWRCWFRRWRSVDATYSPFRIENGTFQTRSLAHGERVLIRVRVPRIHDHEAGDDHMGRELEQGRCGPDQGRKGELRPLRQALTEVVGAKGFGPLRPTPRIVVSEVLVGALDEIA